MKKLLLATLLASCAFSTQAQTIIFGMETTYPPFESVNEKGEIIGFDVDIANAICEEIKATCKFKSLAFDALIPSLIKKRGINAAISAIDYTEDRAKQVGFSDFYYDSSASFLSLKDKTDLTKAKKIGVQNGTTYEKYANEVLTQYKKKSYASVQEAALDLKSGRIDAVFGDTDVLGDMISKDANFAFSGEAIKDKRYFNNGLAIAVNKKDTDLISQLNQGLAAIKANGKYQQIYNKWIEK